jgi:pyridoxine 5-phosphate synthase
MVEIHTGLYANSHRRDQENELNRIMNAMKNALDIGLLVNAGHGLNYWNVSRIASLQDLRGLYIGHSIISRAVLVGMEKAVREMKDLIQQAAEQV